MGIPAFCQLITYGTAQLVCTPVEQPSWLGYLEQLFLLHIFQKPHLSINTFESIIFILSIRSLIIFFEVVKFDFLEFSNLFLDVHREFSDIPWNVLGILKNIENFR